jgi:L-threonylcarbamoyladenylate synthase
VANTPPFQAVVLHTHTPALFESAVQRAAALLRLGQVVALPTETVYGLAANALDATAVSRIYEIKGRPSRNPLIIHVADLEMARNCACFWPPLAEKLARAFWPGPLTLVVERAKEIPLVVTAGGTTVGVRWPSHPFIQAVIRQCGFPLAAPSANPSNQVSPTNAEHVLRDLGNKISLIVDGGQSHVGIESTVLDLSTSPPRLLRPGMVSDSALLAVTGHLASGPQEPTGTLKSPGQLQKHYSPQAKLVLLTWQDDSDLKSQISNLKFQLSSPHLTSQISNLKFPLSKTHIIAHTSIPSASDFGRISVIPHDSPAFARAIYAELRQCDAAGAELIVVESLPESSEWRAIADRLKRAATPAEPR